MKKVVKDAALLVRVQKKNKKWLDSHSAKTRISLSDLIDKAIEKMRENANLKA